MSKKLKQTLQEWNGTAEGMRQIYDQNSSKTDFLEKVIGICVKDKDLQKVGSWLIKNHYDLKQVLPNKLHTPFIKVGVTYTDWVAKLNFLQVLPKLDIEEKLLQDLDDFVRACLHDENKFVRAWSYQGFYEVTKHIPEFENELRQLCELALERESASIKSRVRKVVAQLDKKDSKTKQKK